MKELLAVFLLFAAHTASATSPVLIPTMYNGPGAFGTRWSTIVVLNNHSPASFSSPGIIFGVLCSIPEGCYSDTVLPGEFGDVAGPNPANGLLLYLPDQETEIAFMARFAASPRYPLTGGTELPIVREREFLRRTLHFPYLSLLPFTTPTRTTLRIYGPDAEPGTTVRVELTSWTNPWGPVEVSRNVALSVPAQPAAGKIFPAYAQVNLQEELLSAPGQLGASHNVAVVPLPLASGEIPRIWAFITITDDISQEVTVQRPQ